MFAMNVTEIELDNSCDDDELPILFHHDINHER